MLTRAEKIQITSDNMSDVAKKIQKKVLNARLIHMKGSGIHIKSDLCHTEKIVELSLKKSTANVGKRCVFDSDILPDHIHVMLKSDHIDVSYHFGFGTEGGYTDQYRQGDQVIFTDKNVIMTKFSNTFEPKKATILVMDLNSM